MEKVSLFFFLKTVHKEVFKVQVHYYNIVIQSRERYELR